MKTSKILSLFLTAAISSGVLFSVPLRAQAATPDNFLKADGMVLKDKAGTGSVVNLRGTNLGGWLTQENWMSPLGAFAMERTGWTVSSSLGADSTGKAVDGDASTAWSTGTAQTNGQWFQVNLGSIQVFSRIQLDTGSNTGSYPAGYQVLVSSDGSKWTDVASGTGSGQSTVIRFVPQKAQYIKVVETGTSANAWSISEFNIFSDPVYDRTGWTATASSTDTYGDSANNALDGDPNTRWSSGTAQVNGQWFVVDMGKGLNVGSLLIDSGATSAADYPRGYQVQISDDGQNWESRSQGLEGNSRCTYMELQGKTVRYIRILQTGVSQNWWSISELVIYGGDDFNRQGWKATASSTDHTYNHVESNALDGNSWSRWSTGAAQTSGQWFQVDMGATQTFNQIELDSGDDAKGDYPVGYTVSVSGDGTSWKQVASGSGGNQHVPINFNAVSARYIKVTQTGNSGSWWSIGEFNVHLYNDDYSMYEELKTRFGSDTAEKLLAGYKSTWVQSSDFDNIKSMGMNCVRLPISWHELLNDDGTWKSNPWTNIDWVVKECAQRGIYVILDLHTAPGGDCPWGSSGQQGPCPNGFWASSKAQDMVNTIWQGIAARYNGNSTVAAYDLLNEPLLSYDEHASEIQTKSDLYNRLYKTVRAVDPDHVCIMEGFYGCDKVASPSDYGWTNIMYQVHPYNMDNPLYHNRQQNSPVNDTLRTMADYQKKWNVPLYAGEYCLYGFYDVWSNWMSGMNAMNMSWTNWSYKVTGDTTVGSNWGFYYGNTNPAPVLNSDNSATIASKWTKFGTANFKPNTGLAKTVSKFTGGQPWIATTPLDQTGWTATASSSDDRYAPKNALDWDSSTRWSTGTSQVPGQWFQVDMGANKEFDQVSFDASESNMWDFARGYQIQASDDAQSWRTIASGEGFGDDMVVQVTPQCARYLRVVQTDTCTANWWSIAEFHVYSENAIDHSGWKATASSTDTLGDTPANGIDGSLDTRWSSGAAQENGQWYQVDMGSNQTFNRILMDTASAASDYPAGYKVQVSTDAANWTTVATGNGAGASTIAEFPVQVARYVKILQTGSSSSWWSIAELNVYGENQYDRSKWTATLANGNQDSSLPSLFDGKADTRWSTGAPQANGQAFVVNMGKSNWINHIVMDSGTYTGDYARKYIVEVSNGGDKWTQVATGEGTGSVVAVNFPICQAQYIRVTLAGTSGSWWSVSEFNAYQ